MFQSSPQAFGHTPLELVLMGRHAHTRAWSWTGERERQRALDALERVVRARGDWARLLGPRARLDRLTLASGGYLRDLFRLLQGVLRQARGGALPVEEATLDNAIHEVRNSYLPLARNDALWLSTIMGSHNTELVMHRASGSHNDQNDLYNLSRFFDTHMVLCYRNGDEWYDVHPLLREEVRRQQRS